MATPATFRFLARLDARLNRIYGSRWNPLYHSGSIAIALLAVLLATGVYLLLFYRIGAPYASVVRLQEQAFTGRWLRALHRYASDAAIAAALVHAFRMYAQRRTWGPRALAWVSGVLLLALFLFSGWTGYVLVWDQHGQLLAVAGARLLDVLPIFSEPIGRTFVGERALPSAFFFINLFAHIALPIGLGVLVWVHVARVARPILLPTRVVLWGSVLGLTLLSVLWPAPMPPEADVLRLPHAVPSDFFFSFWLPLAHRVQPGVLWLFGIAVVVVPALVPWLTKPKALPTPAAVNERVCTGCEQCVLDCPYEAIVMVPRTDGRDGEVARVKTELCTSCGICVGSCAPMAIGPLDITARDQLAEVRELLRLRSPGENDVVLVGCEWSGAATVARDLGTPFLGVPCVGAMHSSTVELLLRGGAGGVLVVGCPEHDGRTREGVTWTEQRLYQGRPADLKERVARERIRLVQATLGEHARLHRAAQEFAEEIEALAGDAAPDIVALCRNPREVA